jgi:hypothetical protein
MLYKEIIFTIVREKMSKAHHGITVTTIAKTTSTIVMHTISTHAFTSPGAIGSPWHSFAQLIHKVS